jgi:hypothetical protein
MSKKSGISDDMPDFFVCGIRCFCCFCKKDTAKSKEKKQGYFYFRKKIAIIYL